MSGPNPPDPGSSRQEPGEGSTPNEPTADVAGSTGFHSRAYSAPESEQITGGPYVPMDLSLYDYDSYGAGVEAGLEPEHEPATARWPWVVGVAAIVAAIALVVSVSLLATRTHPSNVATPVSTTPSQPPVQDEITTTTVPPPPPPPPPSVEPPPPSTETVTVTAPAPPPPSPPPSSEEPAPPATTSATAAPAPASTTPARPRQITYSVTGTKAPFDSITITYVDASGYQRTLPNAYIPWSMTVTPISQSDVGSVQASSRFGWSHLNCSITTSDGTVLSSNNNNAAQANC